MWSFSGHNASLHGELRSIDPNVDAVFAAVEERLRSFDSSCVEEWRGQDVLPRVHSYLLRYVTAVYELQRTEDKTDIDTLVIELLSCVCWRHFDNCVDLPQCAPPTILASLQSVLRLQHYAQRYKNIDTRRAIHQHLRVMSDQSLVERLRPVPLTDIWKRCSILCLAPELANLSQQRVDLFKAYINYAGLAHDAHDLFDDVSTGIRSLPASWLDEVNPERIMSVERTRQLFRRIREEAKPVEDAFEQLDGRRFPLISHVWMESWRTLHDD